MSIEYARKVIDAEAKAISSLKERLDSRFSQSVKEILSCRGRIVLSGMGKAGIIAQKISATFASTGTPSVFINPAEAVHGDLGRIVKDDIVIFFSNSGETDEIVKLIPYIKKIGTLTIAITSSDETTLAKVCDISLSIGQIEEPCPLKLAPSASTSAMLAIGDAVALTVLKERGFDEEQYAFLHPGGELGKKLKKVEEIMRIDSQNPIINENATVKEALLLITSCRAGAVSVTNKNGKLTGIFTDGDLRRHIAINENILKMEIREVMTKNPLTVSQDKLATEAAQILISKKIDELPVVDAEKKPVGMIDIQDLLELGIL